MTALVLEGGSLRASYTSGLINALLEEAIAFDWVGGISAGASLLANYLSGDQWRTRHAFTDFLADRRIGGWGTFVRGRGLFHGEYIYERAGLPDGAMPFQWDAFAANPAEVAIGAVNVNTGESIYWGREDLPTLESLLVRVRASSSMPVLMPPVTVDGQTYLDGAIGPSGGIPLDAAQAAGHSRFLIVLSRERNYLKPPQGNEKLLRAYFRRYPAVAEALIARPANYNAMRDQVFDLASDGAAYAFVPESIPLDKGERSVPKLRASYQAGLEQARREMPAIKEFLGL